MSLVLFQCPVTGGLPAMPDQECTVENGLVIAIALQRVQATPTFTNDAGANPISEQAGWTTQIAASDATAIRIIPVNGLTIASGEAITTGGNDGTTRFGVPKLQWGGFSQVAATLQGATPATAKAARAYTKFSRTFGGDTLLRVFYLFESDYIGHAADFNGAPAFTYYVGDVNKTTNFHEEDNYPIGWTHPYGWTEDLVYTKAEFSLAKLKNT